LLFPLSLVERRRDDLLGYSLDQFITDALTISTGSSWTMPSSFIETMPAMESGIPAYAATMKGASEIGLLSFP